MTDAYAAAEVRSGPAPWSQRLRSVGFGALALGLSAAAVLGAAPSPAHAASRAWLIAGQTDPRTPSQRPEAITLWIGQTLAGLRPAGGGVSVQTWLADPVPALATPSDPQAVPADHTLPLQPLARLYSQQAYNAASLRRQRVGSAAVGVRAEVVGAALDRAWLALGPADKGLLFYTGALQSDPQDLAGTTLRLWDNTALAVRELDTLARRAPATVPLRFVATQCHAHAFQRLIRPGGRDAAGLAGGNRCVFTAEPVHHLGRGCATDGGAADDGQDYASHFFAALGGRSRAGAALRRSPDLDGDRQVTLREAHLHATIEADGADLGRASSETYLERWQPLWLRYVDTVSEPDNLYGRVAMALAERLRLPLRGRALLDALQTRQQDAHARLVRLAEESQRLDGEIERLQSTLRRALAQRWPAAEHPHTAAYAQFLANDVGAAQAFLLGQTATYPTLVARQERQARVARDQQALDRELTQLDKLLRLRQLARLQAQFDRHASAASRQELAQLLRCEQTTP